MNAAGKDRFGHFVSFDGFRSAMPDEQTARACAAAAELLEACEFLVDAVAAEYPVGKDGSNIDAAWEAGRRAVARAKGN